ncbi:RNA polymerase II-associated protein 3-like isoform X1 [Phoenix dactylifera]|uniref:RNA polymerase II-associated protein 3-like isoform X1 n=1 Tax=Phoenix dactylifera TaxID=42345 RepID=A0A8B8ZVE6_PHODC|nr:RNA polymerase II-associated protein 3-like isoform X1 [Phoenix dactylifera]
MAGVSGKPDRDRSLEFQGFLNDLEGWDYLLKDKGGKMKGQSHESNKPGSLRNAGKVNEDKGPLKKVPSVEVKSKTNVVSEGSSRKIDERYNYLKYSDAMSRMRSSFYSEEKLPDAASEKELGNEYFKQKKFPEAIECYSRSIALSPTSVAFANRAMAYLKLKRFEEAENDCTEALNLDDRYVKAYSRRATARKELGKLKASMEDSEFAMRLEPNNQELKKQYTETKALYEKEIDKKISGPLKKSFQGIEGVSNSEMGTKNARGDHLVSSNSQNAAATAHGAQSKKDQDVGRKHVLKASMQDLASRAASRVMATAGKSIAAPKTAYEFEVSWRALSDDCALQTQLLKSIPPPALPQIFKNALSVPILIDIIKCTTTFFKEDTELAVNILDNLAKVPRFDMMVMCLSSADRSELQQIWEEVFSSKDIAANYIETLSRLRSRYCNGK